MEKFLKICLIIIISIAIIMLVEIAVFDTYAIFQAIKSSK